LLGGFNRIFLPAEIHSRGGDGYFAFGSECQGCWSLLMDPTIDESPWPTTGSANTWSPSGSDSVPSSRTY